jgi:hypothetical protein
MNDILDFISELKELETLYNTGDLRNFDFQYKIQKYERMVEQFEADMFSADIFNTDAVFYSPAQEV